MIFLIVLLPMAYPVDVRAAQDYCPYGDRTILLFVDRTTAYDDTDRELFASGLEYIFETLHIGEEIILHTIEDEHSRSQQVFKGCYPGCPNAGILDWIFGACKSMEARADRVQFQRKLADAGRDIINEEMDFPFSDIAATVVLIVSSYNSLDKSVTNIYIFSDLVENSRRLPWPAVLRTDAGRFAAILKGAGIGTTTVNAEVGVFGFGRFHDKDRRALTFEERGALLAWWNRFFTQFGIPTVSIKERL